MIRPAAPGDVDALLALVHELAAYEHEPDAVRMSPSDLMEALFSTTPVAFCHVATSRGGPESGSQPGPEPEPAAGDGDGDGEIVGFALWYTTFSTWTGRPGVHLEDLFVRPAHRRAGHGRALLTELAALCVERGYRRLEWSVLDWNTPAQAFYRALGAAPTAGWDRWRLDGDELTRIAGFVRFVGTVDPGSNSTSHPFLIS